MNGDNIVMIMNRYDVAIKIKVFQNENCSYLAWQYIHINMVRNWF